jgi:hypothetical protein
MKKIVLGLMILYVSLFSMKDMYNAQGDALGAAVTVIGANGNVVEGNPALLSATSKKHISATSRLSGLAMKNDSVISLLLQSAIPVKKLAGTFGVNAYATFNNIKSENPDGPSGLVYAAWKVSIGYGFTLNPKIQLGFNGSVKGVYVNESFLDENDEMGTLVPKFNVSAGLNLRPIQLLNVGILAGNLISFITSQDYIDDEPGFLRAGAGFHIKIFKIGTAVSYAIYEQRFTYDLAGKVTLPNDVFRAIIGMEITNYKGGFVPKIAVGTTLGTISIDYSFAYPVSGIFQAGDHKISFGLVF